MRNTYKRAFGLIKRGNVVLLSCVGTSVKRSVRQTTKDCIRGIIRHPLVFLCLVAFYIMCIVSNAHAKSERDASCKEQYHLSVKCDSLSIMLGNIRRTAHIR